MYNKKKSHVYPSLFSGYIGDILEDLGHPLTDSLSSLNRLLKLNPKELSSSDEPQKWIQVVTSIRNL